MKRFGKFLKIFFQNKWKEIKEWEDENKIFSLILIIIIGLPSLVLIISIPGWIHYGIGSLFFDGDYEKEFIAFYCDQAKGCSLLDAVVYLGFIYIFSTIFGIFILYYLTVFSLWIVSNVRLAWNESGEIKQEPVFYSKETMEQLSYPMFDSQPKKGKLKKTKRKRVVVKKVKRKKK